MPELEPLSDASLPLEEPPDAVYTENERLLIDALLFYCRGEVSGRSFLISGHRGAGKTTLVQRAFLAVLRDSRRRSASSERPLLRPLLVSVHGPSLFADAKIANNEAAGVEATGGIVGVADAATHASSAPAATSVAIAVESPSCKALVALEQIVQTLHRSVVREFSGSLRRKLMSQARIGSPRWNFELAAEFEAEISAFPTTSRLRELYRRVDALGSGVLWESGLGPHAEWEGLLEYGRRGRLRERSLTATNGPQGSAELLALSTISYIHRRISGKLTGVDTTTQSLDRQKLVALRAGNNPEFMKATVAGLTGMIAWLGLGQTGGAVNLVGAAGAAMGGLVAALGAALVFSFSSKSLRSKRETKEYQFIEDLTLETLDRALPQLFDRLRRAGLAPVFMIDELDKVKELDAKMHDVVGHLKKLVAENAMFFFLTDRDYYEYVTRCDVEKPYSVEYTYFQHRLFAATSATDCETYLRGRVQYSKPSGIIEAVEEEIERDYPVLLYLLRHRSRLHALTLQRQVSLLFRGDRIDLEVGAIRSKRPFRVDVTQQVVIELLLKTESLRWRLRDEPAFVRLVHDALYYLPREAAELHKSSVELGSAGRAAFVTYLAGRVSKSPAAAGPVARRRKNAEVVNQSALHAHDRDLDELYALVERQAVYLSNGAALRAGLLDQEKTQKGAPLESEVMGALLLKDDETVLVLKESLRSIYEFRTVEKQAVSGNWADDVVYIEAIRLAALNSVSRDMVSDPLMADLYSLLGTRNKLLPTTPSWEFVKSARERLERHKGTGSSYPEEAADAGAVVDFAAMLRKNAGVLAHGLIAAVALGTLSNSDSIQASVLRGIHTLVQGLGLQEINDFTLVPPMVAEVVDQLSEILSVELRTLRPIGEAPPPRFFRIQLTKPIGNALTKLKGAELGESVVKQAWSEAHRRVEQFLAGRTVGRASVAEMVCSARITGPAVFLGLSPDKMSIVDWSNCAILGRRLSGMDVDGILRRQEWLFTAAMSALGWIDLEPGSSLNIAPAGAAIILLRDAKDLSVAATWAPVRREGFLLALDTKTMPEWAGELNNRLLSVNRCVIALEVQTWELAGDLEKKVRKAFPEIAVGYVLPQKPATMPDKSFVVAPRQALDLVPLLPS
jgi:Cdc6-like AAA superfamily ATPase